MPVLKPLVKNATHSTQDIRAELQTTAARRIQSLYRKYKRKTHDTLGSIKLRKIEKKLKMGRTLFIRETGKRRTSKGRQALATSVSVAAVTSILVGHEVVSAEEKTAFSSSSSEPWPLPPSMRSPYLEPESESLFDIKQSLLPPPLIEKVLYKSPKVRGGEERTRGEARELIKVELCVDNDVKQEGTTKMALVESSDEAHGNMSASKYVNILNREWLLAPAHQRRRERDLTGGGGASPSLSFLESTLSGRLLRASGMTDLAFSLSSYSPDSDVGKKVNQVSGGFDQRVILRSLESQEEKGEKERAKAQAVLKDMKSRFSMRVIRFLGWSLSKLWRVLFEEVYLDVESLERIRNEIENAGPGTAVVFLPTHKSHLDYLMMSYVNFAYELPIPIIAAGNNLNIPVFGPLLRGGGSFFIRRSFRGDNLYKEVLKSYLHGLLEEKCGLEFFIEGGRSRHGRVCAPKVGMLSMIVDYLRAQEQRAGKDLDREEERKTEERREDVLLVPISIDYDRVLESAGYAKELLGKPKERESIWNTLRAGLHILLSPAKNGKACVRYGSPVSLGSFLQQEDSNQEQIREVSDEKEKRCRMVNHRLAETIANGMQKAATIVSTPIVTAVLLSNRQRWVSRKELLETVEWLVSLLEELGVSCCPFTSTSELVNSALTVLGDKVRSRGEGSSLAYTLLKCKTDELLDMSFYRNQVLFPLLGPSTVAVAYLAALKESGWRAVTSEEVEGRINYIQPFLRRLCLSPSSSASSLLSEHCQGYQRRGRTNASSSSKLFFSLEEDPTRGDVVISLLSSTRMALLASLVRPYLVSCWATLRSLPTIDLFEGLSKGQLREVVRSSLLSPSSERILSLSKESLSSDLLDTAFAMFVEEGVLKEHRHSESGAISYSCQPPADDLSSSLASPSLSSSSSARVSASLSPSSSLSCLSSSSSSASLSSVASSSNPCSISASELALYLAEQPIITRHAGILDNEGCAAAADLVDVLFHKPRIL